MKTISKFILAILAVSFMTTACDDMNSIIQDDLDKGEAIYPSRPGWSEPVDDVLPGMGRVWVFWALNLDSRIDSTIISYTFNGETKTVGKPAPTDENYYEGYRLDSIEITGLEEGYYFFSMYTIDKDGHRSITTTLYPQTVHVYGEIYLGTLSARSIEKTEMLAGGNLQIIWANDTTNVLYSLITHTDYSESSSATVDTVFNKTDTTLLSGFKRFQTFSVKSYRQVGLDVEPVEIFYASPVVEKALLSTAPNTFTELTVEKAGDVSELTYPFGVGSWTLQDLYYFPNLHTLDLTPGTTGDLPALRYIRNYADRSDVLIDGVYRYDTTRYTSTIGGGPWLNFVSGYMPDSDIAIIDNLLESGQLTTVKYTRYSYPKLDAVLEKYPDKIVWNPVEPLEESIMIPRNLLFDYRVIDRDKGVDVNRDLTYAEDGSNVPAAIKEKFTGELKNVYRVVIGERTEVSATNIAFVIPVDHQLNLDPYGRLKFDCYIDCGDGWLTPAGISKYEVWKKVKVILSRTLPGYESESPYQESDFPLINGANPSRPASIEYQIADKNLGFDIDFKDNGEDGARQWTTVKDGNVEGWDLTSRSPGHYRVIRIQFGADDAPRVNGRNLTYYLANLRWSK
jgi:hypothetical protein